MNFYNRIISKFPKQISLSFAYGSGVKPQLGYSVKQQKLIDFIFCVENPQEWHAKNLRLHADHYSGLKLLGSNAISCYQSKLGAGVYYNTLVHLSEPQAQVKYGVISIQDLIDDLSDWNQLYVAGRLHKPVIIVTDNQNPKIHRAIQQNLQSALRIALLLLPERFSAYDLFYTISNLSYQGDFRMIFGENKNKVGNIVKPQLEEFRQLYKPIIEELNLSKVSSSQLDVAYEQDKTKILEHVEHLPKAVRKKMIKFSGIGNFKDLSRDPEKLKSLLVRSINSIVWQSSISQSLKNIPTAGFIKSIVYSWRKALKTFS